MNDYRFDALGWYQFERLIQGLLKAELSLAIESWGGQGDWGRDAWCETPLPLIHQADPEPGPFLFQVKFVERANAAGARPVPALKNAVNAEVVKRRKGGTKRKSPRHYVFVTNAPVSPAMRTWIGEQIATVHPSCAIHVWGGKDVGDILHQHPLLCRAYPEILSLRNLDVLLAEVVNRDILNRSADALAYARDLAPSFVATGTYFRAFEVLGKHHFVVLDGPPEMGKTAIARMIGLAQVASGWEAYECLEPQDIDRVFHRESQQVFIADDAFGRTEYDPMKGHAWESAIPRLLHRLDGKHWLLWTSRKHILERALSKMDLQSPARAFPNPGEVVVTASDLTLEEKALILYRHAKAAGLKERERALVKTEAKMIVESWHFTPERIRRLCDENLKSLCTANLGKKEVAAAIREGINNPTASMRKSYRALPEEYRWLLIARLRNDAYTESGLLPAYEAYVGPVTRSDFHRRLDDMDGTFLRHCPDFFGNQATGHLDWVHPSFRDLVIDHLAEDLKTQEHFWSHAGTEAVAIALSESGGASGERRWPLLKHEQSWRWFATCCERLSSNGDGNTLWWLMNFLSRAWEQDTVTTEERERLSVVAKQTLNHLSKHWRESPNAVPSKTAWAFSELARMTGIDLVIPDLARFFYEASLSLSSSAEDEMLVTSEQLDEWLRALRLLRRHQAIWFTVAANLEKLRHAVQSIKTAVTGELKWTSDDQASQAEHLRTLSLRLSAIREFLDEQDLPDLNEELIQSCDSRAEQLETEAVETEEAPPSRADTAVATFDLGRFFADL